LGVTARFFKLAESNCFNMKKICFVLIFLVSFNVFSHAQTTPAQSTPAKTKKPAGTTTKTATSTSTSATASKTATTTAAGPTKKDGTADMRYKSNKEAAKPAPATVHTKKDGTPDKRYKENKK
jgi:LAS superfamily LD-carboxypeptidase LdcB